MPVTKTLVGIEIECYTILNTLVKTENVPQNIKHVDKLSLWTAFVKYGWTFDVATTRSKRFLNFILNCYWSSNENGVWTTELYLNNRINIHPFDSSINTQNPFVFPFPKKTQSIDFGFLHQTSCVILAISLKGGYWVLLIMVTKLSIFHTS